MAAGRNDDQDPSRGSAADRQVAAQGYAASLLPIDVNTPQEQADRAGLTRTMGLDAGCVQIIQQTR